MVRKAGARQTNSVCQNSRPYRYPEATLGRNINSHGFHCGSFPLVDSILMEFGVRVKSCPVCV